MTFARLLLACALSACPIVAAGQDAVSSIGIAEWVHPDALASRPQQASVRSLMHGDQVILREEVKTGDLGAADFFFANSSRLLVGPACQVTLDRRYYDSRLDVEVKEFSLDTRLRCIAKADSLGAEPADLIVLNTPHGQIQVRNGVAMIALASVLAAGAADDGPQGAAAAAALDVAGMSAPLIVVGEGFGPGGAAVLIDRTGRQARAIIRRGGFYSLIGTDRAARGPVRDDGAVARAIRTALEGLRPQRPARPGEYVLNTIDSVVQPRLTGPRRLPLRPPTNCRLLFCEEPRVEVEEPVVSPPVILIEEPEFHSTD